MSDRYSVICEYDDEGTPEAKLFPSVDGIAVMHKDHIAEVLQLRSDLAAALEDNAAMRHNHANLKADLIAELAAARGEVERMRKVVDTAINFMNGSTHEGGLQDAVYIYLNIQSDKAG